MIFHEASSSIPLCVVILLSSHSALRVWFTAVPAEEQRARASGGKTGEQGGAEEAAGHAQGKAGSKGTEGQKSQKVNVLLLAPF